MAGTSDHNPFVGPRPLEEGGALYGRTREIEELFDQLNAQRVVVLHSPSGAGKSSLVQAGLVPRLRQARFDVWPPIRVSYAAADLPAGANRFLVSALQSLENELPPERQRTAAELSGLDLATYVRSRPRRKGRAGKRVVLVFDQFEEILTSSPRAVAERLAFFDSVGRALDDGDLWALFVIREDYLGAIAPFRDRIPTHLTNAFRLDLLTRAGAREVAVRAAQEGGRTFAAADLLVDELAKVRVQQPDGTETEEPGIYVEPVQLQVVCRRLWEALPPDTAVIDASHVAAHADVSTALAGYYALAVARAAGGDAGAEREIREWVGERLIVAGIRTPVRRGVERSGGLSNRSIEGLVDSYLVRTEQRGGATWYELAHDRLVAPIREDNAAWDAAHLHPVQVQARLWSEGRRAAGLLLTAAALADARAWLATNAARLTPDEAEFVARSRELRASERRQRLRERVFLGVILVALLLAVGFGASALVLLGRATASQAAAVKARDEAVTDRQRAVQATEEARRAEEEAKRQAEVARRAELEALGAQQEASAQAELAVLARADAEARRMEALAAEGEALEAARAAKASEARAVDTFRMQAVSTLGADPAAALPFLALVADPDAVPGWSDQARDLLARPMPVNVLRTGARGAASTTAVGVSGAHDLVVGATGGGDVLAWRAASAGTPEVLVAGLARVRSLVVAPSGDRAAWISDIGTDRVGYGKGSLWRADGAGAVALGKGAAEGVWALAFASDGTLGVAGSDGSVGALAPGGLNAAPVVAPGALEQRVFGLAWVGGGHRLVIAGSSRLWTVDADAGGLAALTELEPGQYVRQLGASADGELVAIATESGRVFTGSLDGGAALQDLGARGVSAIAFVGRAHSLAVGFQDGRVGHYGPSEGGLSRQPVWLLGHSGAISALAASGDGERLVSASADGTVRVWSTPPAVSPAAADVAAEVRQRASLVCIQPEERTRFLGEAEAQAVDAARTCVSGLGL
jgi:hypothetical protein